MIFEKIVSEGLAHNSYFVGSAGKAAVIDPRRDCHVYTELEMHHDVKITHIFETHRNEDYIIGSVELSQVTGAGVYHGLPMDFAYGTSVKEGDTFSVDNLELGILETPGHTYESISITVKDKEMADEIYMVFTGDALFAGDVGRTDFFGEEKAHEVAGLLYDSLFEKLLPLGDGVIVCPAHGAGSVCGAKLSEHEFTTIGYEKKTNPLLKMNRNQFIEYKINEKLYTPPYFKKMEAYNKNGPPILHGLPHVPPLTPQEVQKADAQILDARNPPSFAGGHIPGSINIWKNGVPMFAGWVLTYDQPIIIVDESSAQVPDIVRYLIRMGYDNILGYLGGGFSSWSKSSYPFDTINDWSVHQLKENLDKEMYLLDVREIHNLKEDGYIKGTHHVFVGELQDHLTEIPKKHVVVYCDSGLKTSIATSILKKHHYTQVTNVLGGMAAWKKAGYPVEK
ncbi:MAG: MBL fold metallo-hydrolase [Theionarchaea archaeon]|nr:MBL fold metallo-hydrolase [Theionarchaea archaeon]